MMNEGSFANGGANTAPFNLADIWQFPINVGAALADSGGGGGGGLGLRRPHFAHNLGPSLFGDYSNRDASCNGQINHDNENDNNTSNNNNNSNSNSNNNENDTI